MAKSFTYLDEMIHDGDREIFLDDDIILSPEEEEKYRNGIDIDGDFIFIDGNGHKIDARAKSRIFNIHDCIFDVYNFSFENGFSNEEGGAILMSGDDGMLTAYGCIFSNNRALNGGALLAYRKVKLEKCIFTDNESMEAGPAVAVSMKTDINVTSCEFKNNVSRYGGAIANAGRLKVSDSKFEKNTSKDCGAAISSVYSFPPRSIDDYGKSKSLKVENSIFKSNSAEGGGGAIDSSSPTEIRDCRFNANVSSINGGALSIHWKTDLSGSTFNDNSAGELGGAIHNSADLKITDCEFRANVSAKCGGAVSNKKSIDISGSKFVSNRADKGGAIANSGFFNLSRCVFNDNNSKMGGALYNGHYFEIADSRFNGNWACECGGAIFNRDTVKIDNSLFVSNHSDAASAIYNSYWLELFNSRFEKNYAQDSSEPIINEEKVVFVRKDNLIERYSIEK